LRSWPTTARRLPAPTNPATHWGCFTPFET
jgi:hypothetical protein